MGEINLVPLFIIKTFHMERFRFTCNEPIGTTLSYEWFQAKTRFDTEAKKKANPGMACCEKAEICNVMETGTQGVQELLLYELKATFSGF